MMKSTEVRIGLLTILALLLIQTAPVHGQSDFVPLWQLDLRGVRAVIVLPPTNYDNQQFHFASRIVEDLGGEVVVASLRGDTARSENRASQVTPERIAELDPADFQLFFFIGGRGAEALFSEPAVHDFASSAMFGQRTVVAISEGLGVLAYAGTLTGREVAASELMTPVARSAGAQIIDELVVRDGSLFTGAESNITKRVVARAIRYTVGECLEDDSFARQ